MNDNLLFQTFEYIRSAANLRLLLEPWITDQNEAKKGKKLFYAVDTDIVKMYTNPVEKRDYASVFPDDDPDTREILARAVARYIFFRLNRDLPLFIVPPHDQEIDMVFLGIALNAAKEQETVGDIWSRIERYVDKYNNTGDIERLIASLEKEPLNLIRCLSDEGSGYTGELGRVNELLNNDRLLHIERYKESDHHGEPWAMPTLQAETYPKDYDTLKKLVGSWSDRLNATSGSKKKERQYLITNDAEVLARLEWINRELEIERKDKRLILISGSTSLQQAAENYLWDEQYSFADLFVRDPRVFLSVPDLVSSESLAGENTDNIFKSDLIGWLDVFLARYQSGRPGYEKRFQQDILHIKKNQRAKLAREFTIKMPGDPEAIPKFKIKWKKLISYAAMKYGLGSDSDHLHRLANSLVKNGIDIVRNEVEKRFSIVTQGFWELAATAGYWSTSELLDTKKYMPLRGVPALRFTFEPEQTIAKNLCRTLQYKQILEKNLSFAKLKTEDPTGYTGFLLHALAFGAGGRWIGTLRLSEIALQIAAGAERRYCLSEGHEPITGNEAAYLLAWAIRHNAKVPYHLKKARLYLNKAKELKAVAVGHDGTDIRYESENIAIDMTNHLFRVFSDFGSRLPMDFPSLAKCQKNILDILERLEKDEDEKRYVRITVKKQLLAYFYCAALLRRFKEKESFSPEEENDLLEWLPHFNEIIKCEEHRTRTCFTQPVYLTTCCIYGSNSMRTKCKFKLEDILSENKVRHCYVMPYDEALYEFFRHVARD